MSPSHFDDVLKYWWRAREVAKHSDVTYDTRRREELTNPEYQDLDEEEILESLLDDDPGTRMNFDRFGITYDDFKSHEVKERKEATMLESNGTLN